MVLSAPLCVTEALTAGPTPGGYKGGMRLREAYDRLEWGDTVSYERAGIQRARRHGFGARGVGTSAHMLIEMYLDMDRAYRAAGPREAPAEFLVVCPHVQLGRYLRGWLETIHRRLGLDVETSRVRFMPLDQVARVARERRWYSWAVYCDHAVKDGGRKRNLIPYRFVRSVERVSCGWQARDRDGDKVCELTDEGCTALADAATCPLTMLGGESPATYPAYQDSRDLNRCVLLREAFAR